MCLKGKYCGTYVWYLNFSLPCQVYRTRSGIILSKIIATINAAGYFHYYYMKLCLLKTFIFFIKFKGNWVLLQNCHLDLYFMRGIFDILVTADNIHELFRLWITTEINSKFPINLLQVKSILDVT